MSTKADNVNALAAAGYTLIPLCPLSAHEHQGRPCKTPGKVPTQRDWDSTVPGRYDPAELAKNDSYGVLLKAGDLVIDIDPRNFTPGDNPVARLLAAIGGPLKTFVVKTGGGGYHIYLRKPADVLVRNGLKEYPGIEFKSAGRQVVGPGSKHHSGQEYAVTSGTPNEIADAPTALLALIERTSLPFDEVGTGHYVNDAATQGRYLHYLEHQAEPSVQGQSGDATAFKVACRGRDLALPPAVTLELMIEAWNENCQPPWSVDELREKVTNAYRYAASPIGAKHPAAAFDAVAPAEAKDAKKRDDGPPSAKDLSWNTSPQGKFLKTFNNLLNFMLASEYGLARVFGYNEFTGRVEFRNPAPWHRGRLPHVRAVGDDDLKLLKGYMATRCSFDASIDHLESATLNVAYHEKFHPVREYLAGLKWDGVPRLDFWLRDFMGAADTPFNRACASKVLCAAVWRVLEPGVKFDHVLILEGQQDLGKSTAIEILGGRWSCDAPVDPHSRDTVDLLQGRWLVEMAEMEVTRRTEEEALKAFITRKTDLARLAYGRVTREFPRQSIFIATKNPRDDGTYLKDEENRRWWPVRCEPKHGMGQIDFDGLHNSRDQLFAEAVVRRSQMTHPKELSMHTAELKDAARGATAARYAAHEWTESVAQWIERCDKTPETRRAFLRGIDVFTDGMGGVARYFDSRNQRSVARVMRELGWVPKLKWIGGRPVRGYERLSASSDLSSVEDWASQI